MSGHKKVIFTLHAEDKIGRLVKIGVTKKKVLEILKNPEKILEGYYGRKIAQGSLSNELILRIVFEESNDEIVIVTIYPGEGRRYR